MESPMPFIHHLGVFASSFERSEKFYTATLESLGIAAGYRADGVAEYWHPDQDTPSVSLERADQAATATTGMHLAFTCDDRATVDAFHAAGLAAGGTDNGAPGLRPQYHPGYYGAFALDPDGNNVEAVHHTF